MSTKVWRSTYLSRHPQFLREQRGLRPGQLAIALGASNPSKVGSLIRSFELGDPLSDHWLQALIAELQPEPDDVRRCLTLDQEEAQRQLEQERLAWETWAEEPIEPFLTIRYIPAVYGVREVPNAFSLLVTMQKTMLGHLHELKNGPLMNSSGLGPWDF